MDNLELISDQELRHRLMEYGFPNLPVTSTSRKILIKKLRNYMNNEKQKLRNDTSHATRYSSDEDISDRESTTTKTTGRRLINNNNRATTIGTMSTTSTQYSNISSIHQQKNSMPPPAALTRRNTTSTAAKRITSPPKVQSRSSVYVSAVHRSESDTDESDHPINGQQQFDVLNSSFLSQNSSGRYSPNKRRQLTMSGAGGGGSLNNSENHSYGFASSPSSSFSRPYNGLPLSNLSSPSMTHHPASNTDNSPFMSDFTRRLLNLREATVAESSRHASDAQTNRSSRSKYFNDSSMIGGSSGGGSGGGGDGIVHQQYPPIQSHYQKSKHTNNRIAAASNNVSINKAFRNFMNKLIEQYSLKQTFVPCILVTALIVFLAVVAFMYMTISPDLANAINAQETIYTPCIGDGGGGGGSSFSDITPNAYNCIERSQLNPALDVVKLIARELQKRIEFSKCTDTTSNGYIMSTKDVINLAIEQNPDLHVVTMIKHLHAMQYLIKMNPQWRINCCDESGSALTYDTVCSMRNTQNVFYSIVNPRLPFTCTLYNKMQTFFITIGGIGLLAIISYFGYFMYNIVVNVRQERKDKVNRLINEIINALIEKSSIDGGSVVMNHLRDKLLSPVDRNRMEWAWQAAIEFLETNESRIQFEIGLRNGEDCKMMRWVDSVSSPVPLSMSSSSSSSPTSYASPSFGTNQMVAAGASGGTANTQQSATIKRWQSPAFDKTNKVKDPPTPCLKIRQMFDSYEANKSNLKQIIQDAILEKVGMDCKIYDIELDKNSCCVYVRCATPADAGIVHDRINGWWFDSSLVSIKFLRLDRYLSRFPKSSSGPMVLRPSNTKNLSMSDCINVENGHDDNDDNNEIEMDGEDE